VFFRPYWAFLFALFCLAARNFHAAVFTRPPFVGHYLNLNDLLLWIALFAMMFDMFRTRKMLFMPKILFAIFIIVFIGNVQSLFTFGLEEYVLRRIWSTAIFPILFLVSANMVRNEERARLFYWAFFGGAFAAAAQHMVFILSVSYQQMPGISQIRTISYMASGGLFLIISAIFEKQDKSLKGFKLISYYVGIALIALSYILALTRGIYIIGIISVIVFPFLLKGKYVISRKVLKNTAVSLFTLFLVFLGAILLLDFDIIAIVTDRLGSIIDIDAFVSGYETRLIGQQTEIEIWLEGSLIFGIGNTLPPEYLYAYADGSIKALNHVAYATYLAHYGLIGLFVYVFLLPFSTIFIARKYYFKNNMDFGGRIALVAIACALFDFLALAWSSHHLGATSHISGLIYGSIWGLYRSLKGGRTSNEIF